MIFNKAQAQAEYEIKMFRKMQKQHFGWKMIFNAMALAGAKSADFLIKNA